MESSSPLLFSILGIASAACGWFVRVLWERLDKLREDHENHKLKVAEELVKKDDLRHMMNEFKQDGKERHEELKSALKSLAESVNKKQDKA